MPHDKLEIEWTITGGSIPHIGYREKGKRTLLPADMARDCVAKSWAKFVTRKTTKGVKPPKNDDVKEGV